MIVPRPPVIEAAPAGAAASVLWAPRIAIVWPNNANGNQTSVALSQFVNISVWPANQVSCSSDPQAGPGGVHQFYLWVAKNNEPAQQVLINPVFIQRTVHGVTFPSDEYNNVPVDLVTSPADQYRFSVGLVPGESNIWVHAADARTYAPNPVIPTGYGTPGQLDSRLQIVWPHDGQGRYVPVDQAAFVNIAVDLFIHGTVQSVLLDFQPDALNLQVAAGNSPPTQAGVRAQKSTYTVKGTPYPRWVFNNIPVQPGQQYQFLAPVYSGKILSPYTSIWTHAADARTLLPNPTVPSACTP
jgi:hypothetical protein